jgi:MFS transporter, FHS family, glucose/mannose:H+ symporter
VPSVAELSVPNSSKGLLDAPGSRKALGGFFVSGLLLSFIGVILPAWGHHLTSDYSTISLYFLGLNAGILLAIRAAPALIGWRGIGTTLVTGCATACGSILFLASVSPPANYWWRILGLAGIGLAAGLLHSAVFHAISPIYQHDPAATTNVGGICFGLGCFAMAILVSAGYYRYTVPSLLILIAAIPGFFAIAYSKVHYAAEPLDHLPLKQVLRDFRSPGAVLFSLLLFFQFGNEWSIAGWLSIFLIQRLGMSPTSALLVLAVYWLALLIGRVAAQAILPRVSHAKLLLGSVLAALFGCLILSTTDNVFGAVMGILLVGGGFAPIYPLVVEKIGSRFPYYHPGVFNGIFSFAFTGAMLAPCLVGLIAGYTGVQAVMWIPLVGSCMVFVLLLCLWLEARLSGIK